MQLGRLGVWTFLDACRPTSRRRSPAASRRSATRAVDSGGGGARSVRVPRLPRRPHRAARARHRHRQHLRARSDDDARQPEDAGRAVRPGASCSASASRTSTWSPGCASTSTEAGAGDVGDISTPCRARSTSDRRAGRGSADRPRGAAPGDAAPGARPGARRASLLHHARAHRARARHPRPRRVAGAGAEGAARDAMPTRRARWHAPPCRSTSACRTTRTT